MLFCQGSIFCEGVTIHKIDYICIYRKIYVFMQHYIIQYYPHPSPKAQGTIVLPTLGWYRLVKLGIFPGSSEMGPKLNGLGSQKKIEFSNHGLSVCVCT